MIGIHQNVLSAAAADLRLEGDPGFPGPLADDGVQIVEGLILLHRAADGDHLAGIDAAGLQDLFDKVHEIAAGGPDLFQVVPDRLRHALLFQAQVCQTADGGHGRPHVMAHVGQEGFLFPSALHRLAQRLRHFFDLLLVVHLLCGVHEGDDQTAQHAGFLRLSCLRSGEHG